MSRLWVINLDFEQQLAAGVNYKAGSRALQWNRRYAWIAAALADASDALWLDSPCSLAELGPLPEPLRWPERLSGDAPDRIGSGLLLSPWGWSEAICQAFLVQAPIPCATVAKLQSKRWSAELSLELGCALPGCAVLAQLEELEAWLPDSDWVLKTEFGVAGRGALRRRGRRLDERDRPWVERALREGVLVGQRWLVRSADYGLAAELGSKGELRVIGCFRNEVAGSTWQAAVVSLSSEDPVLPVAQELELRKIAGHVAERLREQGYVGPFGIDSFLSRDGALYPLVELNLRWTMGRVACELARKLNAPGQLRLSRGTPRGPSELAIGPDHTIDLA